jgi:hypothetical protein
MPPTYEPRLVLAQPGPHKHEGTASRPLQKSGDHVTDAWYHDLKRRTGESTVVDAVNNWHAAPAGRHLTLKRRPKGELDEELEVWSDASEFSADEEERVAAMNLKRATPDRADATREYKSLHGIGGDPALHQRGLYMSINVAEARDARGRIHPTAASDETRRHEWFLERATSLPFPASGTRELDVCQQQAIQVYCDNVGDLTVLARKRRAVIAAWRKRADQWEFLRKERRFADERRQFLANNSAFALVYEMLAMLGGNGLSFCRYLEMGFPIVGLQDEPRLFGRKGRIGPIITRAQALAMKEEILAEIKRHTAGDSEEDRAEIWRTFLDDCEKGYLEGPYRLGDEQLPERFLPLRRFVVWQRKLDGRIKPRACDNAKHSGTNKLNANRTPIRLDSFATLATTAKRMQVLGKKAAARRGKRAPAVRLFGHDEEAAYKRRIIREKDRKFAVVVTLGPDGELYFGVANVLLFGLESAVLSYNCWGLFLNSVSRRFLHAPCVSYFDDIGGAGFEGDETLPGDVKEFLELPGALFAAEKSTGFASSMVFLGAMVEIIGTETVKLSCTLPRLEQVREQIGSAQKDGQLRPAEASELAGRLTFAISTAWSRAGRAFLWPIYNAALVRNPPFRIGKSLKNALEFWAKASFEHFERFLADDDEPPPTSHILTDATTKRIAGMYKGAETRLPSSSVSRSARPDGPAADALPRREFFSERSTEPIDRNEAKAVVRSVELWCRPGDACMVFIDNETAQGSLVSGTSTSERLRELAKTLWLTALRTNCALWLERVPTKWNGADSPGREKYDDLERRGFRRVRISA